MKTFFPLVIAAVVSMSAARADLAYYTGPITLQRQGAAENKTFAGQEVFLVDVDTDIAISIFIFPAQHRFQQSQTTFRHAIVPIGAAAKTATILEFAGDEPGISDVVSATASGKNSQLAVTDTRIITTPRVFKYNSAELFYGGPNYYQFSGLLSFNAKKTLAANGQNQTPGDIALAITTDLFARGYMQTYP